MNPSNSEVSPLATDHEEYDSQTAHTIWELERAVNKGRASEATRRVLVQAHASQLQTIEERAGVASESRSFLMLQQNVTPGVLMLPGEGVGCESLRTIARYLHRAGFNVLCSSLSYRDLDVPGQSPKYWQTCADEADKRFEMLQHYTSRMSVLGVGLSAAIAIEIAAARRVHSVVALFPTLHADVALRERFKNALRKVFPRAVKSRPKWDMQRRMVVQDVHQKALRVTRPIFVVAEDRNDRSEQGRSVRAAQRLLGRRAGKIRLVPSAQAVSPSTLPEAVLDEMSKFIRQR